MHRNDPGVQLDVEEIVKIWKHNSKSSLNYSSKATSLRVLFWATLHNTKNNHMAYDEQCTYITDKFGAYTSQTMTVPSWDEEVAVRHIEDACCTR